MADRIRVTSLIRSRITSADGAGQQLQAGLPETWKRNGRNVFIADGSHVSMPDTPQNQAGYPQPVVQQPGVGFPLARLAVLLSLATGACHDLALAPYAGKGTGETTLLRQMYGSLQPGDVVVADALFDNYFLVCELLQRGVDIVARVQAERVGSRTVESRPDGDIIVWRRPNKPRGMSGELYRSYPETLTVRQVTIDARGANAVSACLAPLKLIARGSTPFSRAATAMTVRSKRSANTTSPGSAPAWRRGAAGSGACSAWAGASAPAA